MSKENNNPCGCNCNISEDVDSSKRDLKNKTVLIRTDYNVPVDNDRVVDDFRIRQTLPSIKYCLDAGAKLVISSHLGRPKGKKDRSLSLMPVGEALADCLEMPIKFSNDCISEDAHDVTLGLKPGEIHLLENLRFYNEETENDDHFSVTLASLADIYVNDAFSCSHRAHASIQKISKFLPSYSGLQLDLEVAALNKITEATQIMSNIEKQDFEE